MLGRPYRDRLLGRAAEPFSMHGDSNYDRLCDGATDTSAMHDDATYGGMHNMGANDATNH